MFYPAQVIATFLKKGEWCTPRCMKFYVGDPTNRGEQDRKYKGTHGGPSFPVALHKIIT